MDALSRVHNDLAGLRQRVRSVFGVKLSLPKLLMMRSTDVLGIIEQSLMLGEHALQYAQDVDMRLKELEKKK